MFLPQNKTQIKRKCRKWWSLYHNIIRCPVANNVLQVLLTWLYCAMWRYVKYFLYREFEVRFDIIFPHILGVKNVMCRGRKLMSSFWRNVRFEHWIFKKGVEIMSVCRMLSYNTKEQNSYLCIKSTKRPFVARNKKRSTAM